VGIGETTEIARGLKMGKIYGAAICKKEQDDHCKSDQLWRLNTCDKLDARKIE
jgi:hypothetical protein